MPDIPPTLRSPAGGVIAPPASRGPTLTPPGGAPAPIEVRYREPGDARGLWLGGTFAGLALIALGLVFWPGSDASKAPASGADAPTPTVGVPPVPDATIAGAATGEANADRATAQAALQRALAAQARLELAKAPRWAADAWSTVLARMAEADAAFQRNRFTGAVAGWDAATAAFAALEAQRAGYLQRHLAAGDAALAGDRADAALDAYRAALAADPDSAAAEAGRQRAATRPALLARLAEAGVARERGDLAAADAAYRAAEALDAADPRAAAARAEVADVLAETRFKDAMSQALGALQAGRYGDAERALRDAAAVRPDAHALADLRRRLADAQRGSRLQTLRREGEAAARAERWNDAATAYEAALALDPNAAFARDGLTEARDRAALHAQLDHYLERPERLYAPEPLANAETLLKSAADGGEPGLDAKIERLRKAVALARTPLPVTLRSDGETEVTIYHVERLGRFQELGLELLPGDYTAVGVRDGYRDVRRVFQLRPGVPVPPIGVRCSEPL